MPIPWEYSTSDIDERKIYTWAILCLAWSKLYVEGTVHQNSEDLATAIIEIADELVIHYIIALCIDILSSEKA